MSTDGKPELGRRGLSELILNKKGQAVCRDEKESERLIAEWIKGGPVPPFEELVTARDWTCSTPGKGDDE